MRSSTLPCLGFPAGMRWLTSPAYHTFRVGLAVSLCLHTGLLMLELSRNAGPQPPALPLEIVLVNAHTESTPVQPRLWAQAQLDGGGEAKTGYASSPLPRTAEAGETLVQAALRQRQQALETQQHALLAQLRSAFRALQPSDAALLPTQLPAGTERDQDEQAPLLQHAQIAALAELVQAYDSQPRKHFFAPSTSPSRYARYVDTWRNIVETVGTRHYPPEARGRVYGWLRMTVAVRADGSVSQVTIDQPSPHAVLNQAARRTVQLAAPFPPFPPDIAQDSDEISITRTWHFVKDRLHTQTPQEYPSSKPMP